MSAFVDRRRRTRAMMKGASAGVSTSLSTGVLLVVVWEILARTGDRRYLPPLSDAIPRAYDLFAHHALLSDIRFTLTNIALGFLLACVVGVTAGLAIGLSRFAANTLGFLVEIFQSAPASALVPVIVVLFGLGRNAMVTIVFVFAFFIVTISTAAGVRSIPASLHDLGRSLGASRVRTLRRIVIPGATPMMFTGFKLAMGRAVNGGILAELLIAIRGLGGRMMFYGGSFDFVSLYALVLVVLALTYALMGGIQAVGTRLTRWQ